MNTIKQVKIQQFNPLIHKKIIQISTIQINQDVSSQFQTQNLSIFKSYSLIPILILITMQCNQCLLKKLFTCYQNLFICLNSSVQCYSFCQKSLFMHITLCRNIKIKSVIFTKITDFNDCYYVFNPIQITILYIPISNLRTFYFRHLLPISCHIFLNQCVFKSSNLFFIQYERFFLNYFSSFNN